MIRSYKSASGLAKIFLWLWAAILVILAVLYYGLIVPPYGGSDYFGALLLGLFSIPFLIAWATIGIILLSSKTLANKTIKKIVIICLTVVTVLCISLPLAADAAHNIAFESTAWKNGGNIHEKDPIRKKMIRSLLSNDRLIGKSPSEITELLGSPSRGSSECDLTYYIGEESGFGVDSLLLCIDFNQGGGRVVAAKVITD